MNVITSRRRNSTTVVRLVKKLPKAQMGVKGVLGGATFVVGSIISTGTTKIRTLVLLGYKMNVITRSRRRANNR